MLDQFSIRPDINIRHARQDDLRKLEWFGLLTPAREHIERAYARAKQGEMLFLVADLNNFPVGQAWVVIHAGQRMGTIQALRVLQPLQNLGIGTRLIQAAEYAMIERGLRTAEIAVGLNNPSAKRLYERLGYRVIQDRIDRWSFTPPGEALQHVEDHNWILHKTLEPE